MARSSPRKTDASSARSRRCPYGPFTWISMVLVDPVARGRHVGTTLLQRGLELVGADATARLDATPAGEAIYRKLGFADEYRLARWFLDVSAAHRSPNPARGRSRVRIGRRFARWTSVRSAPHALACFDDSPTNAPEYARVISTRERRAGLSVRASRAQPGPPRSARRRRCRTPRRRCSTRCWRTIRTGRFYLDVPDDQQEWRDVISRDRFRDRAAVSADAPGPAHDARAAVRRICDRRAGVRLKTGASIIASDSDRRHGGMDAAAGPEPHVAPG